MFELSIKPMRYYNIIADWCNNPTFDSNLHLLVEHNVVFKNFRWQTCLPTTDSHGGRVGIYKVDKCKTMHIIF